MAALGICLCVSGLRADDPKPKTAHAPKAEFECRRAVGAITIDGRAEEAAWKRAEVIDNFAPFWLKKGDTPAPAARTKTKARLLWDDEALYFHAEMEDGDLFATVKEQDGACWENDVFELFFKPSESKPAYYEFEVTPLNTRFDMLVPKADRTNLAQYFKDREFRWQTKAVVRGTLDNRKDRDEGWSVEGRIPWSDFAPTGGRPAMGDVWRFTLCRYDYDDTFPAPDLSASAPLSKIDYHHYPDYSPLRFVGEK